MAETAKAEQAETEVIRPGGSRQAGPVDPVRSEELWGKGKVFACGVFPAHYLRHILTGFASIY